MSEVDTDVVLEKFVEAIPLIINTIQQVVSQGDELMLTDLLQELDSCIE